MTSNLCLFCKGVINGSNICQHKHTPEMKVACATKLLELMLKIEVKT